MVVKINKKGMIFTILAISIISFFILIFSIYSISMTKHSIEKRINTMNNFIYFLEDDIRRQLYIFGYRVIFLIQRRISEKGTYFEFDLNDTFREVFFKGTINNEEQPFDIIQGIKYENLQESLKNFGEKTRIYVNLSNGNISVSQDDPWNVKITLTANLFVKDFGNLSYWNKTLVVYSFIPIDNFEDPIYLVETKGIISNKFRKTPFYPFVVNGDFSNLISHLEGSYYVESKLAPSFLKRLKGDISPSENGIESLVYLPKLSLQGFPIYQKTCVDYLYFKEPNPPVSYSIRNMPSWFRLDNQSLNEYYTRHKLYQVENYAI